MLKNDDRSPTFEETAQLRLYESLKKRAAENRGGGDADLGERTVINTDKPMQGPLAKLGW